MRKRSLKDKFLSMLNNMDKELSQKTEVFIEEMTAKWIETSVRVVARQVEIFIKNNPDMSINKLINNENFKSIALQKISDTGYTALYEQETGNVLLHPEETLVGRTMLKGEEHTQDFKEIYRLGMQGFFGRGYYKKLVQNKRYQDKFMCVVPIPDTKLTLAGTIVLEEFLEHSKRISATIRETVNKLSDRINNALLTPINKLSESAVIISSGELSHSLSVTSSDEVGKLEESFKTMTNALRENLKKLSKVRDAALKTIEDLNQQSRELKATRDGLEKRVEERTEELETAKGKIEKQAEKLEATVGRLYNKLEQLEILRDVSLKLVTMKTTNEMLQLIADTGRKLVNAKLSVISLYEEKDYKMKVAVVSKDPSVKEEYKLDRPISGDAVYRDVFLGRKRSMRIDDIKRHPQSTGVPEGHIPVKGGLIAIKLIGRGEKTIGLFMVNEKEEVSRFNFDDEEILISLCNLASIAIEKARLFEELNTLHDSLELKVEERTEKLKKSQERLIHSKKLSAMGKMVSNIAQELSSPISNMKKYSNLIEKENEITTLKENLKVINENAHRCYDIIKNLLSFSRKYRPEKIFININEQIERVLDLFNFDLIEPKIKIEKDFNENLPQTMADFSQIQQAFLNIINNAIEAIRKKKEKEGNIAIKTNTADNKILVEVRDNGVGIPEKNKDKIFEPFFTTREDGKGLGLGLGTAKKIVEEHGGNIFVTSTEGEGATFTIELTIEEKIVSVTK